MDPSTWPDLYGDELFAFARQRVNDRELALDLVQETFLSAIKNKESFRGEMSEKNWLYLILKNKIIDQYRKKKEKTIDLPSEEEDESYFFEKNGHWQSAAMPHELASDAELLTEEFMKVLQLCKEKLSDVQQSVFNLKFLDDLNAEEICKDLGISSSNYWVIMHRVRLYLRDCLQKNWQNA